MPPLSDKFGQYEPQPDSHVVKSLWQAKDNPKEQQVVDLFKRRMLDNAHPFPCIFGVDAVRRETLRYSFIPAGPERIPTLSAALREYSSLCDGLGARTSLITFFEHDESLQSMDKYSSEFWRLLNGVAAADSSPWPAEINTDTESSDWEFSCFGQSYFVVANTPLHTARSSRYFEYFTITFQPRFVFDNLGEQAPKGRRARKIIRGRLKQYDSIAIHPQLGGFGVPGNREWVQYFLADDNIPVPDSSKCPFIMATSSGAAGGTRMAETEVTQVAIREIQADLLELMPDQGSIELQHDQPGKVFGWHMHSLDEELYVLSGNLTLFWVGTDGSYHERYCQPGSRISLPAMTIHGSTAAGGGAYYVIRTQDGRTAVTTFLAEEEWPYPVAASAPAVPA